MGSTLTTQVIRGGTFTLGATVVSRLLGIAGMIYLVRTLTPEDFGLFTMAFAGISSFEILSGLGTGHAIVQSRSDPKDLGVAGLSISSVVGLLMFALLVQFADQFASFFGAEQVSTIVVYLAPLVLARSVAIVPAAFLQKNMWFGKRAVVTVMGELLNTVVSVLAAASGLGFWSLVYGSLARALTNALLSWVLSNPKDWFRPAIPQWRTVRSLLSFGSQSTVFGLLTFVTHMWHNLLLGRALGATAVGYYSRAFAFSTMPLERGVQPLAGTLFPAYSKLQNNPERLKDGYLRSIQVLSLITLPVLLGLCAVSEEFVYVVLGAAWAPMITTLQVLTIMNVFMFFPMATSPLYFAKGVPRYNVGISAIEAASTVFFTLLAVPYGIFGVACASALARALGAAFSLYAVNTLLPGVLSGLFRVIRPPAAGCAVMLLGVWAARPTIQTLFSNALGWEVLVSLITLGAALYVGTVVLVDRSVIGVALGVWKQAISRRKPQLAVSVSEQPRNP
jgi:O-antigen/teichoic acid export membrane protein